eukprot:gene32358-41636_t
MDRLRAYEVFVAVTAKGSFTKAADALDTSPANVTRYVNELEAHLGTRLINRSSRRLSLTESGQALYERAGQFLEDISEAETIVGQGSLRPAGRLRINAPLSFGIAYLSPLWPQFMAKYPEIELDISLADRVVDLVREGYDLSIRIGGEIDPSFVAVKLASNRRVVCATPHYLQRHGTPETLDDLAHHNCLAFNLQGGQQRGWYFQQNGKPVIIRAQGNLDCNDGELLHRWACEGLGLAWRSTWEIQAQLACGEL